MYFAADLEHLNPDLNAAVMTQINEIIERNKGKPGCLIPVLTECQQVVGYLPVELQHYIGEGLNIPGSTIYGVVTFYSFFSMVPRGKHIIRVCLGTACFVKGAAQLQKNLERHLHVDVGGTTKDREFTLEVVRCIGACGLAPVMVVDEVTHGHMEASEVVEKVERYRGESAST
jgi:NADH:ubiquinone oxidoreductase subunit E